MVPLRPQWAKAIVPAMPPMGPMLSSTVQWVVIVRSCHGIGRFAQSSGNAGMPCNCRKVLIVVCVVDRGGLYASTRVVSEWFGSCPHIVAVRGACRRACVFHSFSSG